MKAAALCPLREKSGKLEIFLTRRSLWNHRRNKPMIFPGEWVFAGGKPECSDEHLEDTAVREFREEVGYHGEIDNIRFLRSGRSTIYTVEFYIAQIEPEEFQLQKSEVTEADWMTPTRWLDRIHSPQFNDHQLGQLRKYGIRNRQLPLQTIATLEYLQSN